MSDQRDPNQGFLMTYSDETINHLVTAIEEAAEEGATDDFESFFYYNFEEGIFPHLNKAIDCLFNDIENNSSEKYTKKHKTVPANQMTLDELIHHTNALDFTMDVMGFAFSNKFRKSKENRPIIELLLKNNLYAIVNVILNGSYLEKFENQEITPLILKHVKDLPNPPEWLNPNNEILMHYEETALLAEFEYYTRNLLNDPSTLLLLLETIYNVGKGDDGEGGTYELVEYAEKLIDSIKVDQLTLLNDLLNLPVKIIGHLIRIVCKPNLRFYREKYDSIIKDYFIEEDQVIEVYTKM